MEIKFEPGENGIANSISEINSFGNITSFNFDKNTISRCFTNIVSFSIEGNIPIGYDDLLNEEIKKIMPKKENRKEISIKKERKKEKEPKKVKKEIK